MAAMTRIGFLAVLISSCVTLHGAGPVINPYAFITPPPGIVRAAIDATGEEMTITFNFPVTEANGWVDLTGLEVIIPSRTIVPLYISGDGTSEVVFGLGHTLLHGDTVTINYTSSVSPGIRRVSDGSPLPNFSDFPVINNVP